MLCAINCSRYLNFRSHTSWILNYFCVVGKIFQVLQKCITPRGYSCDQRTNATATVVPRKSHVFVHAMPSICNALLSTGCPSTPAMLWRFTSNITPGWNPPWYLTVSHRPDHCQLFEPWDTVIYLKSFLILFYASVCLHQALSTLKEETASIQKIL